MTDTDTDTATLPTALHELAAAQCQRLAAVDAVPDDPRIADSLPRVVAASDFVVAAVGEGDPALLHELTDSGDLFSPYPHGALRERLAARLAGVTDEAGLFAALRRFRRREAVRIAYRALARWAELDETLTETSDLAEATVDLALDWLYTALVERWGTPRSPSGEAQRMVVLGMGKLGGRELNFSSDIDLIFAFPETGETDAARPRSNDEFFVKLGRQLVGALDTVTPDGRVHRVDMRLRPNGDAGPLALPFSAVETYYESCGREWERYALVKARCVGGDYAAGRELLQSLRPFIYRRYLDYGALEQLRETKEMIAREVRRRGTEENLKTGQGGIREVEFVAQAFQLIRGGRDPQLRSRRLMKTLVYLREQALLPAHAADALMDAYCLLRRAENAVQMLADAQCHTLPADPLERTRVALGAGFDDLAAFEAQIERCRAHVHGDFEQVFSAPQTSASGDGEPDPAALLWSEALTADEAAAHLSALGFDAAAEPAHRLATLRQSATVRALSTRGRSRLDRLMPLLIGACAHAQQPARTLLRTLELVETVARRTAYLALLVEHPMALSQLVRLCDGSAWVARFITTHPLLLDELLDPRSLYDPLGREALEADLVQRLGSLDVADLEEQMEAVRQVKQSQQLKVAAAELSGAAPLMVVSDYLTHIAEAALEQAIAVCRAHLVARHGTPHCRDGETPREAHFAVIAYGKLGGHELSYSSDLDLVFIHDSRGEAQQTDGDHPVDNQVYFGRLAQRIVHFLNTPTPGGIVYEIDTRLRPSGNAGLMSTSFDAFAAYQRKTAWTWEHQALVRARAVAGDPAVCQAFAALRREILTQPRERDALRAEVAAMRERQIQEKGSRDPALFDIKNDRGGLTDIEFIVQYLVLAAAHDHPEMVDYTDNIRLLRAATAAGELTAAESHRLAGAYRAYRRRLHQLALQDESHRIDATALRAERDAVRTLWEQRMAAPDGHPPGGSP